MRADVTVVHAGEPATAQPQQVAKADRPRVDRVEAQVAVALGITRERRALAPRAGLGESDRPMLVGD